MARIILSATGCCRHPAHGCLKGGEGQEVSRMGARPHHTHIGDSERSQRTATESLPLRNRLELVTCPSPRPVRLQPMNHGDVPQQRGPGIGLRPDALPCPVCASYACRCGDPARDIMDQLEAPAVRWVEQPSWMTPWCQAAAANA